jgi:hypothetical protein
MGVLRIVACKVVIVEMLLVKYSKHFGYGWKFGFGGLNL